jgi:hypothetical protein
VVERVGQHADLVGAPQVHLVPQVAGGDAAHALDQEADGLRHRAGDEHGADETEQREQEADARRRQLGGGDRRGQRRLGNADAHQPDALRRTAERRHHRCPGLQAVRTLGVGAELAHDAAIGERGDVLRQRRRAAEPAHVAVREDRPVGRQHRGEDEILAVAQPAQGRRQRQIVVGLERLARLQRQAVQLHGQTLVQLVEERLVLLLEQRAGEQQHARRHEADEVEDELEAQAAERPHGLLRGSCARFILALA